MSLRSAVRAAAWNGGERRFRTPWRLVAASVLLFLGFFVVQLPVVLGAVGLGLALFEGFSAFVVISVVSVPVVVAVLWFVARFIDRRRFDDYGLRLDRRWWHDLGFGLALGAVLQAAVFAVGVAAGWFRITGVFVADGSFLGAMVALLALFLAVGVYEELLARGWLLTNLVEGFGFLGDRVAVACAVLISSGLFGAVHLGNPGASVLSATIITFAGVFLALGYVLTGELGIPIGVHVSWNFFQGPVFGFGVSGISIPASIIAVEPVGPEIATGGAFGPEAGALGITAVAAGILATCWWVWRRDGRLRLHPRITRADLRDEPDVANADTPSHR